MVNESVEFQWCLLSVDLQERGAQQLLKMIAELWVTIRGFSFTKSWLESYKQAKGKALLRANHYGLNYRQTSKHVNTC